MNKLGMFLISILLIVGCAPTPPQPAASSALTPTSAPISTPTSEVWKTTEIIASKDNPVQQNNPANDWMETILAEGIQFSNGFQIKINMESTGVNGLLLMATESGTPWWNGHKRLELFFESGLLNLFLRDGSQEEPIYNKQVLLPLSSNDITTGEITLVLDEQARNIEIQYDNKIILKIPVTMIGNFPNGLFPDNQILEVALSSGANSSVTLISLEFLVPVSDYASRTPTPTPIMTLPSSVIPEGLGVNIHFLATDSEQLDLLEDANINYVRVDLAWDVVESSKGKYDFTVYDSLIRTMHKRGIQIMFILDYGNTLYDEGLAPYTDDGRAAFAQFAAAAAKRYTGKGILWEIWNEPNLDRFWKPQSNARDYSLLVEQTIKAIRQADPSALVIGPAVCCFGEDSWHFIEELGKSGILSQFDAITVHPYRLESPESAEADYVHLRQLLDKYSPDKELPIYSGEWGYSSVRLGQNEIKQAEYLTRSWLVNLSNDINLSIWYDWQNNCSDESNAECNFGLIDYQSQPKPAYLAAKTLIHTLNGYQFTRRIATANPNDYLLLFSKGNESILVSWTSGANHTISLPLSGNSTEVVSMLGEISALTSENAATFELTSSPQYLLLLSQSPP